MDKIVWVDVETTGLDVVNDSLLEVGFRVTTPDLETLSEVSLVINDQGWTEIPSWMDQFIIDMHTKNGLWEDLFKDEFFMSYSDAEAFFIHWLQDNEAVRFPMAGSSLHFDRAVLKNNLPEVEALFHYRNIDVSTIKNLWNLWVPEMLRIDLEKKKLPDRKTHRVLDDIQDSINELQFYKDNFFA